MATAVPELPVLARDQDFERLYRRYLKDVYHYALALLRNPADAEDVTQTTFMNAYRALQRGERIEKPQNWLIKIAHNAARTRYARASRRVKEVPLDDHVEHLAIPEEEKPDVQAVLDALGRLPLNQRAAIVMRELEGRTYAEIADTLNVSVSAVETLLFRARRSLKLKASAVRALAVVPVPTSLTQLFDAGSTAVMGGGALIGTGFLVKAAVAVVAGVIATGVATKDHARRAATAARPAAVALATGAERGPTAASLAAAHTHSVRRTSHRIAVGRLSGTTLASRRNQLPDGAKPSAQPAPSSSSSAGSASTSSSQSSSAAPSSPQSTTTAMTSSAVTSVSQSVSTVESALPVAVAAPTVPPLPVQPPPPPPSPLPKLP
jgi:RNA polymerase sigma factor (sigma-70 family)